MIYSIEPTLEAKDIPASRKKTESNYDMLTLSDVFDKLQISESVGFELLNRYFSAKELNMIFDYLYGELDAEGAFESAKVPDTSSELKEDIDLSPDNLISKVNDNDLKNLVKSAGVKLSGSENKDQLVGMAKALAAQNESFDRRVHKLAKFESTKLKRKKGIPHDNVKVENKKAKSKFLR